MVAYLGNFWGNMFIPIAILLNILEDRGETNQSKF